MFENHRKSLIFNIVSEANYVYILSGQKFLKMPNLASFWKREAYSQTVLPDMSVVIRQKNGGKGQNSKIQMRHFGWFSNNVQFWIQKGILMNSYQIFKKSTKRNDALWVRADLMQFARKLDVKSSECWNIMEGKNDAELT